MRPVVPGATSQSVILRILDATTFLPVTTVTSATSGLALVYKVGPTGTTTGITESDLSTETSAWSSGGMKHTDSGHYRVDIPDAAVPASEGVTTLVSGVATGLIILPAVIVGRVVPLAPTTAGRALDVSTDGDAEANVTKWSGTAIPGVDTAGYPKVTVKDGTGQGEIALTSGAVDSVTTTATATAVTTVNGLAADVITAASIAAGAITSSEAPALANLDVAVSTRGTSTYAGGAVASVTAPVALTAAYDPAKTAAQESTLLTVAGYIDTEIGTIVTGITSLLTGVSVSSIAAGAINAASIAAAAGSKIADIVHRRHLANVDASSDGDTVDQRSPLGAYRKLVNRVSMTTTPGSLETFEEDDTTTAYLQAVDVDATADPTVEVG